MIRWMPAVGLLIVCLAAAGCGIPAVITSPLAAIRPGPTLEDDSWRGKAIDPAVELDEAAPPLRAMSFNLRVSNPFDAFNGWAFRRDLVRQTITNFEPDILGTQEGVTGQLEQMDADLPDYAFVGVGRDNGDRQGESTAIFYRTDRFDLVDHGHFWLSDTPHEVASRSWGNVFNRMATWVHLRDREHPDQQELFVFNTHMDVFSANARYESARLLRRKIEQFAEGRPVIATGDFNADEGSPPYEVLVEEHEGGRALTDSFRHVHPEPTGPEGTMHSFRGGTEGERIDWILSCDQLMPVAAAIDRTRSGRRFPSDHFPVTAVLLYTHGTAETADTE